MLLSDELLEIGRASNPKSNYSMNEAYIKIMGKITRVIASPGCKTKTECDNILKFVFGVLNKEGYHFFASVKPWEEKKDLV